MTSPYRIERDRGAKEAARQLAVLREKWPLAFPVQHHDVRPLVLRCPPDRHDNGLVPPLRARRAWPLEDGASLLPGCALL